MDGFIGIDLGTSYFKVGVFDEFGKLKGLARCVVAKKRDGGVVCELPLTIFWKTLYNCLSEAIQKSKFKPTDIKALSYSSQSNSFILLDKFDQPLTPLILWPDKRVKSLPESLNTLIERDDFREKTGLGIPPGVQSLVAKLDWFRTNRSQIWSQVKSIMSISDYLTFSLTGQKVSDGSTASMTGLFNVLEGKWWNEALEIFNIQKNFLSSPEYAGVFVGKLTKKGANLVGLKTGVSFFLGALDHHMVAVGAGLQCFDYISESTGTVLACVNHQQGYQTRAGINIAPGMKDEDYFQMTFNENGAIALEWYREKFASDFSIVQLLEFAAKIKPGSDGLIAKPTSFKYENLQGFENIKDYHIPSHFVRSILESTSLSLLKLVADLKNLDSTTAIVPSGGGARSELWIQIKADLLNKTFLLPECNELACQGAAISAFIGSSNSQNTNDIIKAWVKFEKNIKPNPVQVELYQNWYNDIIK